MDAIPDLHPRLSACCGVLLDSNVLLDVATNDLRWGDWSARALADIAEHTTLIINPIIYAELSVSYTAIESSRPGPSGSFVSARPASLGGWLPRRQKFPIVPPHRRLTDVAFA